MEASAIDTAIIDGYLKLLNNLSLNNKLDLISKLTLSIKSDIADKKSSFQEAFDAFESNKTAEEIIAEIRNSRTFTRQIEEI